jgi:hypothetical protein
MSLSKFCTKLGETLASCGETLLAPPELAPLLADVLPASCP